MKKFLYVLLCIFIFAGCNNIVLRKDKSERVTFTKYIPQGDYSLYLYELEYPKSQEEKLIFLSKFENFLKNGVSGIENDVNFILPKELYKDINGIITDEGIGIERSFFKSASFIDENDKKIIDREAGFVKTPLNSGEIQKYLNRQYYYILSLCGKKDEYKKDFFYTEYDKRKLVVEFLKERKELKALLNEKKKNFIVAIDNIDDLNIYKDSMVYFKNSDENFVTDVIDRKITINSPVFVLDSIRYRGYTLNNGNIVFFNGEGGNILNFFRRYNFTTKIKKIDNFNYSNFTVDENQLEISTLLDRKKYVPKRPLIR